MKISEVIYNCLNTIVTWILVILLGIAGLYAGYALWDNNRIYQQAENVQDALLDLKPDTDNEANFARLREINPDVCAWITLDGTEIDYPVVMGEDLRTYLNKDVYGNYALAGSIFADNRCARDFSDPYTLIYGHHMTRHRMFGDLELYEDGRFFQNHRTGTLILPGESHELTILACIKRSAADPLIFDPQQTSENITALLESVESDSVQVDDNTAVRAEELPASRILALSTCSGSYEDARTIVLCLVEE